MKDHENSRPLLRQVKIAADKKEQAQTNRSEPKELSAEHEKNVKALQAWKDSTVSDALTFTVASPTSGFCEKIIRAGEYNIKEAISLSGYNILYRSEVAEFLPSGVDLKISAKKGIGMRKIIQHLSQIIEELKSIPELAD